MIRALEEDPRLEDAYLSVYPNSSLPSLVRKAGLFMRRMMNISGKAQKIRNRGARIIGGCCGTTPNHIRAMAEAVKGLPSSHRKTSENQKESGACRSKPKDRACS